jgi:hypothetical protein
MRILTMMTDAVIMKKVQSLYALIRILPKRRSDCLLVHLQPNLRRHAWPKQWKHNAAMGSVRALNGEVIQRRSKKLCFRHGKIHQGPVIITSHRDFDGNISARFLVATEPDRSEAAVPKLVDDVIATGRT